MTKRNNEDFKNSTKCCICDNIYAGGDVKVRHHSHITGKYKGSSYRDCNINVELNQKNTSHIWKPKKLWFPFYDPRTKKSLS